MSFESGGAPKRERVSSPEDIDDLELRVRELAGSVRARLDQAKVEELASTALGQSQLLKMFEASKRLNERMINVLGILSLDGICYETMSNIVTNPELGERFANSAAVAFATGIAAAVAALAVSFIARGRFEK